AQEALQNVAKHANAGRVWITLRRSGGGVQLVIDDDGCGFDPDRTRGGGFGLISMRERAALVGAHVSVESNAERGTSVTVTISRRESVADAAELTAAAVSGRSGRAHPAAGQRRRTP